MTLLPIVGLLCHTHSRSPLTLLHTSAVLTTLWTMLYSDALVETTYDAGSKFFFSCKRQCP